MENFEKKDDKIRELLAVKPEIKIKESADWVELDVVLPYDCTVSGIIHPRENLKELYIGNFSVPKEFQRHGIGEHLTKILIEEAKRYNATVVRAHVISEGGLRSLMKVLGKENIALHRTSHSPDTIKERLDLDPETIKGENISYDIIGPIG